MISAPARLVALPLLVTLVLLSGCQATEAPPTEIPTSVPAVAAEVAPTVAEPTPVPLPMQTAVCWYGSVMSLPEGAQFDDFLRLLPTDAGELGIAGIDEETELLLAELRDPTEPDDLGSFSGNVTCNVQDVGGCRFDVEQVHVTADDTEPEPIAVDGWEGTIVGSDGVADEDSELYFVLGGDFPVRYGITAAETALEDALTELADSDVPVRISGLLSCGTADTYGAMVVVTTVE